MTILKLALKEIKNNFRFSLFFIFNLSLGLSGLLAIDSLKISIHEALNARAKGILSADLGVGARRALTLDEVNILQSLLPKNTETTSVFESYTMISSPSNSRLVELKAIEENYPFYGEIELKSQGLLVSHSKKDLFLEDRVWAYPELLLQLGIKVGEKIKIGEAEFVISDEILRDSAGVGAGFSFAPPLYIAKSAFAKTGLMKTGSTGYYSQLYKLPKKTNIEEFADLLNKKLNDPAIQITTSQNASEQVGRLLGYLSDYLGLAGLVALFLMALGQIFLYRSYLVKKYREIAIYKSIGLDSIRIFKLYLAHMFLLGTLALIPSIIISSLILPTLKGPTKDLLNVDIDFNLHSSTLILLVLLSLIGTLLVCGPILVRAIQIQPKALLQSLESISPRHQSFMALFIYFSPAIFAYYIISLWLAQSIKTGSLFFALFSLSICSLVATGYLLLRLAHIFKSKGLVLRLALRNLTRSRFSTLAAFLTLGMGVLLSNLIPIMESGIKNEITAPVGLEQPSLFLVDIQEDQVEALKTLLVASNISIMQTSPMIRARLTDINGVSFEKAARSGQAITRDEENENRFRNRGFNITYRENLSSSERIVAGDTFENSTSVLPKISLELRFADRLNIKINDKLNFDVQGISVIGQVVNFRKVRWTSFQPNFFIQFEDGPLRDAPKIFLTTLGQIPSDQKAKVQNLIVKNFPNISIVDVTRVIERLNGIIKQMSLALRVMAIFSMLVGFTVLISIASQQIFERRLEINLLKVLGSDFSLIRNIFLIEFVMITSMAAFLGTGLSYLMSFLLATQIFDSAYYFVLREPGIIFVVTILTAILITLVVVQSVFKSHPRDLLS